MLKIAIAEDEISARTALKEYLDRWQAENGQPVQAVFFESGSQLLENIPQGLQLALLDIQMPGLSGMETARTPEVGTARRKERSTAGSSRQWISIPRMELR